MPECCCEERTANFCSVCGKALGPSSVLLDVMRHCLQSADKIKQQQAAKDETRRRLGSHGFADKCKIRAEANEAKWRSWAKAIEGAVAEIQKNKNLAQNSKD